MASKPTGNKHAFLDKPTDPKANKKPRTPAAAKPAANPSTSNTSSYRTEQELAAEARQTQLDLGFILVLSEDPHKALQIAKTDLEKEAVINAIEVQKIVSTKNKKVILNKTYKQTTLPPTLQNDKHKKPAQPTKNPYPNLAAASSNPIPTPTTNIAQMTEQFERLKKQKETVEARQKVLEAQRAKEAEAPLSRQSQISTTTTTTTTTTPTATGIKARTMTTTAWIP